MPTYILMTKVDGEERFLEYSTVVDAPTTWGMPEGEFREYYRTRYGEEGVENLDSRLERCRQNSGSSSRIPETLEQAIGCNRAGRDETELSLAQFVEYYFRGPRIPAEGPGCALAPVGEVIHADDDE